MILQFAILFFSFVFAELWLLVQVSRLAGVTFTILLMLGTGILGAAIARRQGVRNWIRIHEQLARGETPGREICEGLLIFAASVLLIVPGLLSDVAGLLLLIPPIRSAVSQRLMRWFQQRTVVQFRAFDAHGAPIYESQERQTEIIDAEFSRVPAEQRLLQADPDPRTD